MFARSVHGFAPRNKFSSGTFTFRACVYMYVMDVCACVLRVCPFVVDVFERARGGCNPEGNEFPKFS